jgi:hypothetical protein
MKKCVDLQEMVFGGLVVKMLRSEQNVWTGGEKKTRSGGGGGGRSEVEVEVTGPLH